MIANVLPLHNGAQLAIETTLVFPLTSVGQAGGAAANTQGPQWPTHGAAKNARTHNFFNPGGAASSSWPSKLGGALVPKPQPSSAPSRKPELGLFPVTSALPCPSRPRSQLPPSGLYWPLQRRRPSAHFFSDLLEQRRRTAWPASLPARLLPLKGAHGLDLGPHSSRNCPAHQQLLALRPLSDLQCEKILPVCLDMSHMQLRAMHWCCGCGTDGKHDFVFLMVMLLALRCRWAKRPLHDFHAIFFDR